VHFQPFKPFELKAILFLLLVTTPFTSLWSSETHMHKTLIVCGSYSGSTAQVSEIIAKHLKAQGDSVQLTPADSAPKDLSQFEAIIIGSAIHGGKPHELIQKFMTSNKTLLEKKEVAIFAVCATITSSKESKRIKAGQYPKTIADGLTTYESAVFGGNIPSSGRFTNWLGKVIMGVTPGNYIDKVKIEAWAQGLFKTWNNSRQQKD